MKYFNKKQLKALEQVEQHFHTVIYAKYKRATSSKVNDMVADLYEEVTGEILTRKWSCAHCVYALFEKAGKLYYKSLENLKSKKENNQK